MDDARRAPGAIRAALALRTGRAAAGPTAAFFVTGLLARTMKAEFEEQSSFKGRQSFSARG